MRSRNLVSPYLFTRLSSLLVLFLLIHTAKCQTSATDSILSCRENYDNTTDYFLWKATPDPSAGFNIRYNNSYKIVTNTFTNESWCLYCTTLPPSGTEVPSSSVKNYFQIPVTSISLEDIPSVAFLELLGSLDLVNAISPIENVTSPCTINLIANGNISQFNNSFLQNSPLIFTSQSVAEPTAVTVSLPDSLTPLAKANWIHFFAAFTNQEDISNSVYSTISTQYDCHRGNLHNISSRYSVGWVSYDPNGGAWNIFSDTYRTTLIYDAGAEYIPVNSSRFSNTSDFDNAIGGAWMVIDETSSSTLTYTNWLNISGFGLGTAAVNAPFIGYRRVYRTDRWMNKDGFSDWFERGPARPDLVLQDLIAVQYPQYAPLYQNNFLENWAKMDIINYYNPTMCNTSLYPIPPTSLGECENSPYDPSNSTVSPANPISPNQQSGLSRAEKFGLAFGVIAAASLLFIVSFITMKTLKRRKIGFGEETRGFFRMDDLD